MAKEDELAKKMIFMERNIGKKWKLNFLALVIKSLHTYQIKLLSLHLQRKPFYNIESFRFTEVIAESISEYKSRTIVTSVIKFLSTNQRLKHFFRPIIIFFSKLLVKVWLLTEEVQLRWIVFFSFHSHLC